MRALGFVRIQKGDPGPQSLWRRRAMAARAPRPAHPPRHPWRPRPNRAPYLRPDPPAVRAGAAPAAARRLPALRLERDGRARAASTCGCGARASSRPGASPRASSNKAAYACRAATQGPLWTSRAAACAAAMSSPSPRARGGSRSGSKRSEREEVRRPRRGCFTLSWTMPDTKLNPILSTFWNKKERPSGRRA